MNKRRNVLLSAAAGLALALLMAGVVYAATIDVDTFDDGTQTLQVEQGNPPAYNALDVSGVLGGERDLYLVHVSGSGRVNFDADYGGTSNRLAYTSGDGVTGWASATWDGNDSDAQNLDPDGLGSTDLTDGTNDGFLIRIVNDDWRADMTLTAYEYNPSTDYSDVTVRLPGMNPGQRMDIFIPFSSFTARSGDGVDWTDVGSLILKIDGTIDASLDVSIDFVQVTTAREYGDLPVGVYGTAVLGAYHIPQGLRLGYNLDAESAYNSSTDARGDDTDQANPDDEDGVTPTTMPWQAGSGGGEVELVIDGCQSTGCWINGWIDWNNDGDFADTVNGASEHIINNYSRTSDATVVRSFTTPDPFPNGYYYARFRICASSTACDTPDESPVTNGEVEDYRWAVGPTAITLSSVTARSHSLAIGVGAAALLGLLALGALFVARRRQ